MRGNIDQLKFLIQTGLSRYTRTQNVLSSKFYSHETLVFGATDPSSKCRTCVTFVLSIGLSCQYLGCLSLQRRVYIRPDEALTLEMLALENLCGGQFTFNLS